MSGSPVSPADLTQLNTLGLPAFAQAIVTLKDSLALPALSEQLRGQPRLILGGGSNVVMTGDAHAPLPVTVIHNQLRGLVRLEQGPHGVLVRCAAGESWHAFVMWTLSQGWAGLENLALIPGTVGAAPIQNIGAYGVEVCDRIDTVHAWDFHEQSHVSFAADACGFGYRRSRFKDPSIQGPWDQPRYLVVAVDFRLQTGRHPKLEYSYAGLAGEVERLAHGHPPSPMLIAHSVMSLRNQKLPSPEQQGNVGSFFMNPVVPVGFANSLSERNPEMPYYPINEAETKLSAGWLIEACGLKGFRRGQAGVSDRHALVLVNHGGTTGSELLSLAGHIQRTVLAKFGVWLEPEPQFIPPRDAGERLVSPVC
jgi:UDP-N-acetylmuramate dehydrogenase